MVEGISLTKEDPPNSTERPSADKKTFPTSFKTEGDPGSPQESLEPFVQFLHDPEYTTEFSTLKEDDYREKVKFNLSLCAYFMVLLFALYFFAYKVVNRTQIRHSETSAVSTHS